MIIQNFFDDINKNEDGEIEICLNGIARVNKVTINDIKLHGSEFGFSCDRNILYITKDFVDRFDSLNLNVIIDAIPKISMVVEEILFDPKIKDFYNYNIRSIEIKTNNRYTHCNTFVTVNNVLIDKQNLSYINKTLDINEHVFKNIGANKNGCYVIKIYSDGKEQTPELDIYHKLIDKYGINNQLLKVVGEMSEMTHEIMRHLQNKNSNFTDGFLLEFADVEFTMKQLDLIITDERYNKNNVDNKETLDIFRARIKERMKRLV